ncbi:hypothetical protein ACIBKY_26860 [Nonomuraea sp. NPDC050394]|uniref:hypothetical protein n=1 Tax=Nonomuraea sp. NPDC050394 TaxID=3364363 RepID=UPI00378C2CF7
MLLALVLLTLLMIWLWWDWARHPRKSCSSCQGTGRKPSGWNRRAYGERRQCRGKGDLPR